MNPHVLKAFLRRSNDELEGARRAGLVQDPRSENHDSTVTRAIDAIGRVTRRQVSEAFVASLSSRRLELRSAVGSFAVLQHLPQHSFEGPKACPVCGTYAHSSVPSDLTEFNFERYKWGGVRHDHVDFAAFDLEQFIQIPAVAPKGSDMNMLRDMLEAFRTAPRETPASQMHTRLATVFPSNKQEREVVVGILGFLSVLRIAEHPGYLDLFVSPTENCHLGGLWTCRIRRAGGQVRTESTNALWSSGSETLSERRPN